MVIRQAKHRSLLAEMILAFLLTLKHFFVATIFQEKEKRRNVFMHVLHFTAVRSLRVSLSHNLNWANYKK